MILKGSNDSVIFLLMVVLFIILLLTVILSLRTKNSDYLLHAIHAMPLDPLGV
jgi:hypothetical protein